MLFKYIDTERNVKQADGLSVTYFVSGLTKADSNGEQVKCNKCHLAKLTLIPAVYMQEKGATAFQNLRTVAL